MPNHFGDFDPTEAFAPLHNSDCIHYAPLLTAFFDGEATAEEVRRARRHLAACDGCTELWQGWTQTRFLMQQAPVPAVPPGLLARILFVCRLSALPVRKKPVQAARDFDPLWLETAPSPDSFAASRRFSALDALAAWAAQDDVEDVASTVVPPLPAHLKDDILRLTVGQVPVPGASLHTSQGHTSQESLRMAEAAPSHGPAFLTSNLTSKPSRTWPLTPFIRCTAALSVPALAIWLMVLAPLQAPDTNPAISVQSGRLMTAARVVGEQKLASSVAASGNRPAAGMARAMQTFAAKNLAIAKAPIQIAANPPAEAPLSQVAAPQAVAPLEAVAGAAQKLAPAAPTVDSSSVVMASYTPSMPVSPKAAPLRDKDVKPRARSLVSLVKPRLAALVSIVVPRIATVSSSASPMSSPAVSIPEVRLTQPTIAASLGQADVDEMLDEVRSLGDNRPEDVRGVIDDYRAALIDDGSDDEAESTSDS